jgi:flagellar L-ring protein FlgH
MTFSQRRFRLLSTALVVIGPTLVAQTAAGQTAAGQSSASGSADSATSVAPSGPARPPRQSWTSDRRSFMVGDIVNVLVDEYTLASADKRTSALDTRRREASVAFVPPSSAGEAPSTVAADFGTRNDAESRERGEASRENSFRGEMSVRVVAISPNGLLQLKGRKLVNVDKNQQELTLTGWARPQDITPRNTVESWRLGDGELVYVTKGGLGKPKGGFISRIVALIWP